MLFPNIIVIASALTFDAGADLRIRQEFLDNVPGLPNGRFIQAERSTYKNQMRFRPRFWGEIKGDAGDAGKWRVFGRVCDEFRWNVRPKNDANTWPGELIPDNLFVEGVGVFDGLMDVKIGRQDLYGLGGLNGILVDGTPGDGSRSMYTDMARVCLHPDEDSTLDIFGLYNFDDADDFRWGTSRSKHASLVSRFPNLDRDVNQDDFGYGAIWGSKLANGLKYQVFAIQKQVRHSLDKNHTELIGTKLMPRWNEEWSSEFEAMSELGKEWSGRATIGWKSARDGMKPFAELEYLYRSGEWDPMWGRGALESEMFLYGTYDGMAWLSNEHSLKATLGMEFGKYHRVTADSRPIFAAERDGLGGAEGGFKGLLSRLVYSFPIKLADRSKNERFEALGHLYLECFNPGDYYESDKPGWFARWQVEFRF